MGSKTSDGGRRCRSRERDGWRDESRGRRRSGSRGRSHSSGRRRGARRSPAGRSPARSMSPVRSPSRSPARSRRSPSRSPARSRRSPSRSRPSPNRSPARSRRSSSRSPARSRRSPTRSPARSRRSPTRSRPSPSRSPARSRRSPSRSPARSRRSPTRSPARSRRSPTRSPARSRRSPSRSPARSRRSPTRSPARSRRSPSRSPARSRRSPSRSPARSRRSPTRSPARSRRSPTRSPARSRPSPSRSPARSRSSPTRSPARSRRSPTRSPARSRRSRSRSPVRSRRSPTRSRRSLGRPRRSPSRSPARSRRSSSSSSSSSSDQSDSSSGTSRLLSLQEKLKEKAEKKQQRELAKAMETPEEKRARRLARKEAKERKKREKMGWSEEYMGYTNADNPFGDNNLLGTFIWQKALEKKGISHLTEKDLKDRNKRIQEDNRLELQKVKQLRLEREREKTLREQELEMLQREKEAEHFKTWAEQEDYFHLQQAKLRSKIRILGGRAKPIDLLAKYISAEDDDLAVEMHEPYTFLNGLTASDLEDLLEDIRVYMELEQGKNADFWRDMTTITEDEISNLKKLEASGKGPGERREGINTSVSADVQSVFKGKTYNQLQALYQNIEAKIKTGGSNLDIGYWESLLQQLKAYMARARLRERHQDVLRQKLYKLKQEQGVESEPLFPIIKSEPQSPKDSKDHGNLSSSDNSSTENSPVRSNGEDNEVTGTSEANAEEENAEGEGEGEAVLTEEDLIQQSLDDYDAGKYSPKLLSTHELPMDSHIVDADEDMQKLMMARQQLQVTGDASESAEDAFVRKAKEGMGTDEAQFSVEMPLTGKVYLWADKYRPRKPRFFNRVHTGFEWNKYNQTHYDFDNPPPKIVQGYKFNIFYPDLIDKRATPQYFLEPCMDNKDFAILRFHAGPPYEDIAFKIVNREWEYSHRHGFRCQFANGIFQLWFHFKRYRYRR
ncbi:splicing factor Cactin [Narcine bancroftii]|uniref:splicing factor Cactin n=1 Tax=Narcine bancroftii TaxID=1343680 RepID=UPI0038316720